jgi:hypothetical protein
MEQGERVVEVMELLLEEQVELEQLILVVEVVLVDHLEMLLVVLEAQESWLLDTNFNR